MEDINIENSYIEEDVKDETKKKYKNKIENKLEKCKVYKYRNGILYFDFKGFGLEVECEKFTDNFVNIKYTSEIGRPDFKFYIEK